MRRFSTPLSTLLLLVFTLGLLAAPVAASPSPAPAPTTVAADCHEHLAGELHCHQPSTSAPDAEEPMQAAPPDANTTLEGELVELIAETPGVEESHRRFDAVELDNGELVELEVTPTEAAALPPSGTEVQVEGELSADQTSTDVSEVSVTEEASEMAAPAATRRIAVLMTNFTDDARQPWTAAQVSTTYIAAAPAQRVSSV